MRYCQYRNTSYFDVSVAYQIGSSSYDNASDTISIRVTLLSQTCQRPIWFRSAWKEDPKQRSKKGTFKLLQMLPNELLQINAQISLFWAVRHLICFWSIFLRRDFRCAAAVLTTLLTSLAAPTFYMPTRGLKQPGPKITGTYFYSSQSLASRSNENQCSTLSRSIWDLQTTFKSVF